MEEDPIRVGTMQDKCLSSSAIAPAASRKILEQGSSACLSTYFLQPEEGMFPHGGYSRTPSFSVTPKRCPLFLSELWAIPGSFTLQIKIGLDWNPGLSGTSGLEPGSVRGRGLEPGSIRGLGIGTQVCQGCSIGTWVCGGTLALSEVKPEPGLHQELTPKAQKLVLRTGKG